MNQYLRNISIGTTVRSTPTSYPGALNNNNTRRIQVGRRRSKGLLGRVRPGERLAVLVYCHGGKKWNLIQKVTISSYTSSVCKTLLFDEELN